MSTTNPKRISEETRAGPADPAADDTAGQAGGRTPRGASIAEGMARARERGVQLGRPPEPLPSPVRRRIKALLDSGASYARIAGELSRKGVPTLSNQGYWTKSSVQKAVARLRREDQEREEREREKQVTRARGQPDQANGNT